MLAEKVKNSIINVLQTLYSEGLLQFYKNPVIYKNRDDVLVTWPNHVSGSDENTNDAFGTLAQYRSTLIDGSYNAILRDGSILKVSYKFSRNQLIKHSLWYWPCPLVIPASDMRDEVTLDAIDLYSTQWTDYVRFRTPLRFDFAPKEATPGHPASHIHMQVSECRIPVERPLGFASFVRFIFRNFHSQDWASAGMWDSLTDNLDAEKDTCLHDDDLFIQHLAWKKRKNY